MGISPFVSLSFQGPMKECSHVIGLGDTFRDGKKCWVLLASKSPRRIELLKLMGIKNLYICESGFEENLDKKKFLNAEDYVRENANRKGLNVVEHIWFRDNKAKSYNDIREESKKDKDDGENIDSMNNVKCNNDNSEDVTNKYEMKTLHSNYDPLPHIIISCDTIVTLKNEIIEKPLNKSHAYEILKKLSSNVHTVYTAVCIFLYKTKTPITFVEKTDVYFDQLFEEDIFEYLKLTEPYDKAGAYSIQGVGCQFIKKIIGCYYNVMGLPIHKLSKTLTQFTTFLLANAGYNNLVIRCKGTEQTEKNENINFSQNGKEDG
ncbi:septum formation protein MAF homologue, putative [Plasmodium ovale wallikeri]|uniref:Septum formation protein MAF homologue, putative n=1 Tax=Plasmodium ovale wallikeri TaxID=864142 RepID=A0A1A8ZV82_PLAOA|nr:septum formation protein MAF homologue, putative [Plasmodium ovale wallikeri]SBT48027.1 septum formation protein MAF homologue, putative [Plasmodium ovale wallikeri]